MILQMTKKDVLQEVVSDRDLSGGETADVSDTADDKGDSSEGDVSQDVVADCDLSGGEMVDLANFKGDVLDGVVAEVADDIGDSSEGVVADLANDKEDISQDVVADRDLSGGETADVSDIADDKGDSSEEDVSQEVLADCDLSGGETADLGNDKRDVSEGVVAEVADDIADSSERVVTDLESDNEDVEGHVCPHCGLGLSIKVMADFATDEEVLSQGPIDHAHERRRAAGHIDPTIKLGLMTTMVGLLAMTTFNCLKDRWC